MKKPTKNQKVMDPYYFSNMIRIGQKWGIYDGFDILHTQRFDGTMAPVPEIVGYSKNCRPDDLTKDDLADIDLEHLAIGLLLDEKGGTYFYSVNCIE